MLLQRREVLAEKEITEATAKTSPAMFVPRRTKLDVLREYAASHSKRIFFSIILIKTVQNNIYRYADSQRVLVERPAG